MRKTVYLWEGDLPPEANGWLVDFIAWLHGLLDGLPPEVRDGVEVEWTAYDDSIRLYVSYDREETPEEREDMLRQYEAARGELETMERAILKRLREKYEDER